MSDEPNDLFDGLKFLIQYRRKDDGVRWHNMAAFDGVLAAGRFFKAQDADDACPWEYRLKDIEASTILLQHSGGEK
jgi:hypothetical protein